MRSKKAETFLLNIARHFNQKYRNNHEKLLKSAKLFEYFGIDEQTIDPSTIKNTYKKFSLLLHPDKNQNNPNATDEFQKMKTIFDAIANKEILDSYKEYIKTQQAKQIKESQDLIGNVFLDEESIKLSAKRKEDEILKQEQEVKRELIKRKNIEKKDEKIDFSISKINKNYEKQDKNLKSSSYIIQFQNKESSNNFEDLIDQMNQTHGKLMIRIGTSVEAKNSIEMTIVGDSSEKENLTPKSIKNNEILDYIYENIDNLENTSSFPKLEKLFEDTIRQNRQDIINDNSHSR